MASRLRPWPVQEIGSRQGDRHRHCKGLRDAHGVGVSPVFRRGELIITIGPKDDRRKQETCGYVRCGKRLTSETVENETSRGWDQRSCFNPSGGLTQATSRVNPLYLIYPTIFHHRVSHHIKNRIPPKFPSRGLRINPTLGKSRFWYGGILYGGIWWDIWGIVGYSGIQQEM